MVIGSKVIHFKTINSTNEYVKHNLSNLADGDVVMADEQTKGKGRLGRTWYSPQGGLYCSLVLKPDNPALIPIIICLAICDFLKTLGLNPTIKWPNDVLLGDRKIAGILIEIENNRLIIGIGVNVNNDKFPAELNKHATCLSAATGKTVDKQQTLTGIIKAIEERYLMLRKNEAEAILNDWRGQAMILGKYISAELPHETVRGQAIDISDDGSLLLKQTDGSIRKIIAGDCQIQEFAYNNVEGKS